MSERKNTENSFSFVPHRHQSVLKEVNSDMVKLLYCTFQCSLHDKLSIRASGTKVRLPGTSEPAVESVGLHIYGT